VCCKYRWAIILIDVHVTVGLNSQRYTVDVSWQKAEKSAKSRVWWKVTLIFGCVWNPLSSVHTSSITVQATISKRHYRMLQVKTKSGTSKFEHRTLNDSFNRVETNRTCYVFNLFRLCRKDKIAWKTRSTLLPKTACRSNIRLCRMNRSTYSIRQRQLLLRHCGWCGRGFTTQLYTCETDLPRVSKLPPEVFFARGLSARLDCPSTANPPVTRVLWYKDDRVVAPLVPNDSAPGGGGEDGVQLTTDRRGSLMFRSVLTEDEGRYSCKPYSPLGVGQASRPVHVKVRGSSSPSPRSRLDDTHFTNVKNFLKFPNFSQF